MARKKVEQEKKVLTRAQKTEATKGLIKELLAIKPMRHNELLDEVAKNYTLRYEGEDTENVNDVKGRVGSVLDIMKKESDVMYDGGMYALKARMTLPPEEKEKTEVPAPKKRGRAKKVAEETVPEEKAEAPTPKKRGRAKKTEEPKTETPATEKKVEAPATEEKTAEVPAPKKRGRKPKAKAEEAPVEVLAEASKAEEKKEEPVKSEGKTEEKKEGKAEPKKEEPAALVVKPKAEVAQKGVVMDMSFLFGDKKPKASPPAREEKPKIEEKKAPRAEEKPQIKPAQASQAAEKKETPAPAKPVKTEKPIKTEGKGEKPAPRATRLQSATRAKTQKPLTAEEKLKESFLKRMRTLGGDYFEYYSVYLLERYSMRNGRRLEGLRISGGDHDGGIDGEIELTDKLGFKETIYIQSKNWDPEKGKEENWVVGETLLQQFIGACACRQAKDGKQHTRGIFITTSRFTPDAKRILEDMSDKIVGYDGNDLFEAAKECEFGLVKKNGEWSLDEKLLSGSKAFFEMT